MKKYLIILMFPLILSGCSQPDIVLIEKEVDTTNKITMGERQPDEMLLGAGTPIDIGSAAIDGDGVEYINHTKISNINPANATGTITSIEIWANSNLSNVEVATFINSTSNTFSTRDYETIGSVTAGSKQTFTVDLDVGTGDYIGLYGAGAIERTGTGGGLWYRVSTDAIPCTDLSFTYASGPVMSIYATGETADTDTCTYSGTGDWNVIYSDNCYVTSETYVKGDCNIMYDGAGSFNLQATLICDELNVGAGASISAENSTAQIEIY